MSENIESYKQILTRLIKKQIVLLGADLALKAARNIKGITISEDGTVSDIKGDDSKAVMQSVANAYIYLSGQTGKIA